MSTKAVKKLESDIATITFSGGHDSSSDDDSARTQSTEVFLSFMLYFNQYLFYFFLFF